MHQQSIKRIFCSEGNLSPLQLFHLKSHLIQLHQQAISSTTNTNGPETVAQLSTVDVPRTICPLTEGEMEELKQQINTLSEIPHIELYNYVLQFVGRKMLARST